MFLCPIENEAKLTWFGWKQIRPTISQLFGKDFVWIDGKLAYARYGMLGHNGIDIAVPEGTPVFAPCNGKIKVKNEGTSGYGLHVKIRGWHGAKEVCLAHLSEAVVTDGQNINLGELIGYSGNTGYSTGAHLHFGFRFLNPEHGKDIFEWKVRDYNNGYKGYLDPLKKIICHKGGLKNTSLLSLLE